MEKMCLGAKKVSVAPREAENSVNVIQSPWFPNPCNRKYANRKMTIEANIEFRIALVAVAPTKNPIPNIRDRIDGRRYRNPD